MGSLYFSIGPPLASHWGSRCSYDPMLGQGTRQDAGTQEICSVSESKVEMTQSNSSEKYVPTVEFVRKVARLLHKNISTILSRYHGKSDLPPEEELHSTVHNLLQFLVEKKWTPPRRDPDFQPFTVIQCKNIEGERCPYKSKATFAYEEGEEYPRDAIRDAGWEHSIRCKPGDEAKDGFDTWLLISYLCPTCAEEERQKEKPDWDVSWFKNRQKKTQTTETK